MSTVRAEVELVNGDVLCGAVEVFGLNVNDHAIRMVSNGKESLIPWSSILCLTYLKDVKDEIA